MHTGNILSAWALAVHDQLEDASNRAGMGTRDLSALTLIANHPDVTVDWLRVRIGLSQPGTVRLVDRLADVGLVRRSPRQGRSVGLAVTTPGRRVLRRWAEQRDEALAEAARGLTSREMKELTRLLASSLRAAGRDRSAADRTCRTCDWPACGNDCPVDLSVGS